MLVQPRSLNGARDVHCVVEDRRSIDEAE